MSKTHLVLAQVRNEKYRRFYRERGEKGDFLILDNGAYEHNQSLDSDLLVEAMRWYKPNVVVLPDLYLGDWKESLELARRFIEYVQTLHLSLKEGLTHEWMFVPQAVPGDSSGWWHSLWKAEEVIKPAWIGLSRNMVNDKRGTIFESPLARVEQCLHIKTVSSKVKVHALGMQAGCLEELWALNHAGCDSIDSSAPVWRGHHGFSLDADNIMEWPDAPLDIEYGTESFDNLDFHDLIVHNINEVLKRCQ